MIVDELVYAEDRTCEDAVTLTALCGPLPLIVVVDVWMA